nr:PREDICTED: ABC transporter G family member 23-like isoform X2 [Linepithema humile]XP_012220389.1 PREDICTED: ABC transporter G family member 23-like isoform X2 [Linepithema humile]
MVQQEAVVVRNAVKYYGADKLVFDGLNMTVSRGSIYGLLGPSGCGKTTLLSCVVGVRRLNSGEVWVLGGNPGSKGSGIPGPRVGYMPQEISLVGEFTMSDALYYFGRINGLEDEEIDTRQGFLSELLQLPPSNRLVKNMSGGQQRRVSFAAALIHRPELLILDEPTVGLDPILRENIWDYMIRITQEEGVTILITTHYIEEAKDADKIGLIRCGRLLTESSPEQLLDRFQCSSLEEAFLIMSQTQENIAVTSITKAYGSKAEDTESDVSCRDKCRRTKLVKDEAAYKTNAKYKVSRLKTFNALMKKNMIQFLRYYSGLVFAFIFPILQISTFFAAIGDNPKNLTIAIVNDEAGNCNYGSNFGNVWYDKEDFMCHFGNLSCKFLHSFDDSLVIKKYYDNFSDAMTGVHNGSHVGMIYFNQNFSEAMQERVEYFINVEEANILASEIKVDLDMSSIAIGSYLQRELYDSFDEFFKDTMKICGFSQRFASLPIRFEDPIYGSKDITYKRFMAPSLILILVFFLATTLSTALIITDRSEGVWNRSLVQGVGTVEILLAHVLTQIILVFIHSTLIMCFSFLVWNLKTKGSIFDVICIVYLSGFSGLMWGFFDLCHVHKSYCGTLYFNWKFYADCTTGRMFMAGRRIARNSPLDQLCFADNRARHISESSYRKGSFHARVGSLQWRTSRTSMDNSTVPWLLKRPKIQIFVTFRN